MSTFLKNLQGERAEQADREERLIRWNSMDNCKKCSACYIHARDNIFVFIHSKDRSELATRVKTFTSQAGVLKACKSLCDQCYLDSSNDEDDRQNAKASSDVMGLKTMGMFSNFKRNKEDLDE